MTGALIIAVSRSGNGKTTAVDRFRPARVEAERGDVGPDYIDPAIQQPGTRSVRA
jgi:cobyrinic acid a,c-diamide synthase